VALNDKGINAAWPQSQPCLIGFRALDAKCKPEEGGFTAATTWRKPGE
jgi:hypothetical protein